MNSDGRGEWCYFDHTGNSTGRLFVINKHKLVVVFLTKINVLLIQLCIDQNIAKKVIDRYNKKKKT